MNPLPASALACLEQAEAFFNCGDLASAADYLERALDVAPQSVELLAAFGGLQSQLGKTDEALATFGHARDLQPNDPALLVKLAAAALKANRIPEFETALLAALELDAEHPDALHLLADVNYRQGGVSQAAHHYARILKKSPHDIVALLALGRCFYDLGDMETAAEVFSEVVRLDPKNLVAAENLAVVKSKLPASAGVSETASNNLVTGSGVGGKSESLPNAAGLFPHLPAPAPALAPQPARPARAIQYTEDILSQLKGRIAIVGNATPQYPFGRIIDSYATVIRLNNFRLAGFEELVGRKTDFRCTSAWTDIEHRNEHVEFSPFSAVSAESSNLIAFNATNLRPVLAARTDIHPLIAETAKPSTGFSLIQLCAALNLPVDLFGFDGFKSAHYWEKNPEFFTTHSRSELEFILKRPNVLLYGETYPYQELYDFCHQQHREYNVNVGLKLLQHLKRQFSGLKILEFGAGNGDLAIHLEKSGNQVTAVETSKFAFEAISCQRKVHGTALALPFIEEHFDLFASVNVLEHLTENDVKLVVREAGRLCDRLFVSVSTLPGGLLGPNGENLHLTVRPSAWWEELFSREFEIKVCAGFGTGQIVIEGMRKPRTERIELASLANLEINMETPTEVQKTSFDQTFHLQSGYVSRPKPEYFQDSVTDQQGFVWQPDVYPIAARLARQLGCFHIIDVGCGWAHKLSALHPEFHLTGVDYDENIRYCRYHHNFGQWLEANLEQQVELKFPSPLLAKSFVICSDVIEHLIDPTALLQTLKGLLAQAPAAIISTPERVLTRGADHAGPPPNKAHVREWSLEELHALLREHGFHVQFIGLTRSNTKANELKTTLAVVTRVPLMANFIPARHGDGLVITAGELQVIPADSIRAISAPVEAVTEDEIATPDAGVQNVLAFPHLQSAFDLLKERKFKEAQAECAAYLKLVNYEALPRSDHRTQINPKVSVVIVAYKIGQGLIQCLDSLNASAGTPHEIIVVDNGENEDIAAELAARPILHIRMPMNVILSEGRNIGVHFARAPIVSFVDDDAIVAKDYCAATVAAFENYEICAFRGKVLPKSDHPHNSKALHYNMGDLPFPAVNDTEGDSAYDTAVYRELGGMDTLLFGGEGLEMSYRVAQLRGDRSTIYWPAAVIYHDYAVTDTKLGQKNSRHILMREFANYKHPDMALYRQRIAALAPTPQARAEATRLLIPRGKQFATNLSFAQPEPAGGTSRIGGDASRTNATGPFISICMPAWNTANYLPAAVASALGQTYPNFEVVLVDDGSTDNTADVMRSLAHPKLRFIQKEHSGGPATRNRCIAEARGEFIVWLDSDDILLPGTLQRYVAELERDPHLDVLYGDLKVTDQDLKNENIWYYPDYSSRSGELIPDLFLENRIPNGFSMLRKSKVEKIKGYNAAFTRAHDYEFWSRLAGDARFRHVGIVTGIYRRHSASLSKPNSAPDTSFEARIALAMLERHGARGVMPYCFAGVPEAHGQAIAGFLTALLMLKNGDLSAARKHAAQSVQAERQDENFKLHELLEVCHGDRKINEAGTSQLTADERAFESARLDALRAFRKGRADLCARACVRMSELKEEALESLAVTGLSLIRWSDVKAGKAAFKHLADERVRNLKMMALTVINAITPAAPVVPVETTRRPLKITYLISNILGVTGGNLTLLAHVNGLVQRGHQVTVVTYSPRPKHTEIRARVIQAPEGKSLAEFVPDSDVIVGTYFTNAAELAAVKAPLKIYYAQGDQYVFGDTALSGGVHEELKKLSDRSYQIKDAFFLPNSRNLANAARTRVGRLADGILPVMVNREIFRPTKRPAQPDKWRILIVGPDVRGTKNEPLDFKGIGDIRAALDLLRPRISNFSILRMSSSPIEIFKDHHCEFFQAPPDNIKTALYGTADILVYASHYDSSPRPPLEAMSAGCAVVCTDTAGAREYCVDRVNARMVPIKNPQAIADALYEVMTDGAFRAKIMQGALKTAEELDDRKEIAVLEDFIFKFQNELANGKSPVGFEASAVSAKAPVATPKPAAKFELPACALIGNLLEAKELFRQKKHKAAWESTVAAIKVRPFHPEGYLLLGEIAQAVGNAGAARQCGQQARAFAPDWKPAKKFLQSSLKGTVKLEWLVLSEEIRNPQSAIRNHLSVCLIVKNEEKFLGQCLSSVKEIAHQIVVMDTGSTDRTVEIAKEFGAEVHHFKWCDDFSAARNSALEHVTGDWVLVLDADEELQPEGRIQLQKEMQDTKAMAFRLPLTDREHEDEGVSYVGRLFRNAPALFYVSRVHEQIYSTIEVRREEWGLENKFSKAGLLHHGYTKEMTRDRNKVERNLRLLEKANEEMPGEANLLMNLGLELVRAGRENEGLGRYREAYETLSSRPVKEISVEIRETLLTQYTSNLMRAKQFSDIVRVLQSSLAKQADLTASLHFTLGLAYLETQQFAPCAEQMRLCLAKRNRPAYSPINKEILKAGPQHCLGLCLVQLGKNMEADAAFQAALNDDAQSSPARFDYARFLASQQNFVPALQQLNHLLSQGSVDAKLWQFGGQIALHKPEFLEFARDWTGEALKHHPSDPQLLTQRAEALLLSQDIQQALPIWKRLYAPEQPRRAAALLICELVTVGKNGVLANLDELATSRELLQWYRRLIEFGAANVVQQLNGRIEIMQTILPTAATALQSALAEAGKN